jgi:glycosyltransferase involved in cell wall biosynthesis
MTTRQAAGAPLSQTRSVMISIVIPAHNEAAVIARTLRAMTAAPQGTGVDPLDIIVVCNGCSDNTADVARDVCPSVRVIETDIAGKPHALNLGDQAARFFPRIYADADVMLARPVIAALAERLAHGDVLAAAPTPRIELDGCSWAVRAFYAVRAHLPSTQEGIGGSGVYALSEQGRRRFGEFPDLIADDVYVRVQFGPRERETLRDAHSIVFPPRRIRDLIAVTVRAHYGNFELARVHPDLWKNRGERNERALLRLLRYPDLWPALFIYVAVTLIARRTARKRMSGGRSAWERDITSRAAAAAPHVPAELKQ